MYQSCSCFSLFQVRIRGPNEIPSPPPPVSDPETEPEAEPAEQLELLNTNSPAEAERSDWL